jgi:hypothetical protein
MGGGCGRSPVGQRSRADPGTSKSLTERTAGRLRRATRPAAGQAPRLPGAHQTFVLRWYRSVFDLADRGLPESPGQSGDPSRPQRRRSVPIAYEDRLVLPDTLGTTIKLSFLEGPRSLPANEHSQRGQAL